MWMDKYEVLGVETSLVSFGNKQKDVVAEAADSGWYGIVSGQKMGLALEGQKINISHGKELRLLPLYGIQQSL